MVRDRLIVPHSLRFFRFFRNHTVSRLKARLPRLAPAYEVGYHSDGSSLKT